MQDPEGNPSSPDTEARVRAVLERVADRWTLLVVDALEDGAPTRFTRIRDRIPGISQRMLTHTLRQLERDGLIVRTVHPVVPPRVEYTLTPLGFTLGAALCGVWEWVEQHAATVDASRRAYDERLVSEAAPRDGATSTASPHSPAVVPRSTPRD
ncbi:MAG TPA: helix-turn-helix domain-containing protein [Luteitalea sp.]|nr:helix-turn-helix domain-containing protein [Luteitalea sp.]